MNTGDIIEISDSYFEDFPHLMEIMETDNRVYLGIILKMDKNNYFIPLRSRAPKDPVYRKSIYPIPSNTRPDAGLDMRKALIVNDPKYITVISNPKIANKQMKKINNDISTIENMFEIYVRGYKRAFRKDRIERELPFKYSTLKNYHVELGLE